MTCWKVTALLTLPTPHQLMKCQGHDPVFYQISSNVKSSFYIFFLVLDPRDILFSATPIHHISSNIEDTPPNKHTHVLFLRKKKKHIHRKYNRFWDQAGYDVIITNIKCYSTMLYLLNCTYKLIDSSWILKQKATGFASIFLPKSRGLCWQNAKAKNLSNPQTYHHTQTNMHRRENTTDFTWFSIWLTSTDQPKRYHSFTQWWSSTVTVVVVKFYSYSYSYRLHHLSMG